MKKYMYVNSDRRPKINYFQLDYFLTCLALMQLVGVFVELNNTCSK